MKGSRVKLILTVCLFLVLFTILYGALTYRAVRLQSWVDETRPAAAIVVFGAAEYAGRPSPVFRARLDHALSLYEKRIAPMIIVTGGNAGDNVSEGAVGHDYLVKQGVPDSSIIAETQGGDTAESAQRVARIMKTNKMADCVAVSDDYHMYRIKQMLGAEGIVVYGAPRPQLRQVTRTERMQRTLRETVSYLLWKVGL